MHFVALQNIFDELYIIKSPLDMFCSNILGGLFDFIIKEKIIMKYLYSNYYLAISETERCFPSPLIKQKLENKEKEIEL